MSKIVMTHTGRFVPEHEGGEAVKRKAERVNQEVNEALKSAFGEDYAKIKKRKVALRVLLPGIEAIGKEALEKIRCGEIDP